MQTVKLLLKFKVDVNVADNVSSNEVVILPVYRFINSSYFLSRIIWQDGWTPLHVAMQTRCRDIAKVLLINGADKTRRNKVEHVLVKLAGYFVQYN